MSRRLLSALLCGVVLALPVLAAPKAVPPLGEQVEVVHAEFLANVSFTPTSLDRGKVTEVTDQGVKLRRHDGAVVNAEVLSTTEFGTLKAPLPRDAGLVGQEVLLIADHGKAVALRAVEKNAQHAIFKEVVHAELTYVGPARGDGLKKVIVDRGYLKDITRDAIIVVRPDKVEVKLALTDATHWGADDARKRLTDLKPGDKVLLEQVTPGRAERVRHLADAIQPGKVMVDPQDLLKGK